MCPLQDIKKQIKPIDSIDRAELCSWYIIGTQVKPEYVLSVIKAVINKRKYISANAKFKVNCVTTNDGNDIANTFRPKCWHHFG